MSGSAPKNIVEQISNVITKSILDPSYIIKGIMTMDEFELKVLQQIIQYGKPEVNITTLLHDTNFDRMQVLANSFQKKYPELNMTIEKRIYIGCGCRSSRCGYANQSCDEPKQMGHIDYTISK